MVSIVPQQCGLIIRWCCVRLTEGPPFIERLLAERFGYALAYDRDIALAIQQDFEQCLSEAESPSTPKSTSIQVKYFKPNDAGLYALVECVTAVNERANVLIELIVAGGGDEKYITLEQISYVA